jgi:hypothetical protein
VPKRRNHGFVSAFGTASFNMPQIRHDVHSTTTIEWFYLVTQVQASTDPKVAYPYHPFIIKDNVERDDFMRHHSRDIYPIPLDQNPKRSQTKLLE